MAEGSALPMTLTAVVIAGVMVELLSLSTDTSLSNSLDQSFIFNKARHTRCYPIDMKYYIFGVNALHYPYEQEKVAHMQVYHLGKSRMELDGILLQ